MMKLGGIRHGIAIAERFLADTEQSAHVSTETVAVGPVALDGRLCIGPRPIEQARHAVMKNIREAGEGAVAEIVAPIVRIFGQVQRQGPIGAEDTEENSAQPKLAVLAPLGLDE